MKTNSFQNYLEGLHRNHAGIDAGAVASYIPELLKADPAWLGIALIMVDGHTYQTGDSQQSFTIQSISKAITYGLALEDQGIETVLSKVDVEPSGEAFNSISLEPETGRPRNPMINAGAIATVGLVKGDTPEAKFGRMIECYEKYLGHPVVIDEEVYRSEKSTGLRNRAIAYLLSNSNIIEKDPDDVLDVYFKQCSLLVTCEDLAPSWTGYSPRPHSLHETIISQSFGTGSQTPLRRSLRLSFVGAGHARDIMVTITGVGPHCSRAWPAPTYYP